MKRWKIRTLMILVALAAVGALGFRYYDRELRYHSLDHMTRLRSESRLVRTMQGTADFLKFQAREARRSGDSERSGQRVAEAKLHMTGATYHQARMQDFAGRRSIPWTAVLPDLFDPCPEH
jgi:hypothetical protein